MPRQGRCDVMPGKKRSDDRTEARWMPGQMLCDDRAHTGAPKKVTAPGVDGADLGRRHLSTVTAPARVRHE